MDKATLDALAAFPAQLEAHYGAIPDAYRLWSPPAWDGCPSEHLSALEQLCHVRDIEIDGYHVRFVRTLKEDHPFLPGIDGDRLRIERAYADCHGPNVLAQFRRAREDTLILLANLSSDQLSRIAEFEDYGRVTVRSLMHFLCSHDQQHLAGLQWLAGKIDALDRAN
ncbi:hypothetical protein AEAC466_03790 [Asticcacaulis sp. AC466]|uniref:DinB family protein n=1 Tax=Asticcacaulis sp. AC466 TaxID=1282362 RepID=UPI0003C3C215|nr:DinB family protein [Asticcacaulis sp. AC466]ESQ86331.1 hypothetical protein AEAC466_03790 [Asticcacaulis sp. AC466]